MNDGRQVEVARTPPSRAGGATRRKAAHPSPQERAARGKAARAETPRSSHGPWEPAADRPDPIALLEEQRVVAGQRLMQAASDIFLGWQRAIGVDDGRVRDFYVRQLRDWKGSADVDNATPDLMTAYSRVCGATLARAHARSGDRIAIASYLGKGDAFDRAITDFSAAYADQNERDYQALVEAVRSGRLRGAERVMTSRPRRGRAGNAHWGHGVHLGTRS